jgi:hypothetical protein
MPSSLGRLADRFLNAVAPKATAAAVRCWVAGSSCEQCTGSSYRRISYIECDNGTHSRNVGVCGSC